MARPLRLEHSGALWHITNRGVERRDIHLDDRDRLVFLDLLSTVIRTYRWRLHQYCLMTNHFHLLNQTLEPTLSRGMQQLEGEYADYFNRRYKRVGHLYQRRFDAQLVEEETYLLTVARYIVLNPVRARMVDAPGDWAWSSYRATAGLEKTPSWLHTASVLDRFDEWDRANATALYRQFVAAVIGSSDSPWEKLRAGLYLGGEAFMERIKKLTLEGP
jgi:putative transposase